MLFSRSIAEGLCVLGHLSTQPEGQLASTVTISRTLRIPREQCAKVLQHLTAAGLVRTKCGRGGGHAMARPLDELTLGEVMRALMGDEDLARLRPDACTGRPSAACRHHEALLQVYERVWNVLCSERLFASERQDACGAIGGDSVGSNPPDGCLCAGRRACMGKIAMASS